MGDGLTHARRLLVDTGPLLLLAAGRKFAAKFKATAEFGEVGYVALAEFVAQFEAVVVTPHSLTEAWNLSGNDDTRNATAKGIKSGLALYFQQTSEEFTPAVTIVQDVSFWHVGLADTAQILVAEKYDCPLLTLDRRLSQLALARNIFAIHLTDLLLQSPRFVRSLRKSKRQM
jgi:predicted nucleic acid-binding protein